MFRIKIVGIGKPQRYVGEAMREFRAAEPKILEEFGRVVAAELRKRIRTQAIDVPPLTAEYLREKARKGWSLKTFVRTGGYVKSIQSFRKKGKLRIEAVGVDRITGVAYADIAKYLEYGTVRMPPRPHWRPIVPWAETQFGKFVRRWAKKKLPMVALRVETEKKK